MTKVAVKNCTTYDQKQLREVIDNCIGVLGDWGRFIKQGQKVLLKVNLIGPKLPESAAVTHCDFVRVIVQILKGYGCEVWIGDSAGGAIAGIAPTAQAFEVSGLARVAREEGVEIKNFDREGVIEVAAPHTPQGKMYLAKPMFDADVVINLPKLKTHSAGMYTGAVKNLFGCIPGLKKAEYHRHAPDPKDLGLVIADIHQATQVQLHIMDGIMAMQGEGPTAGTPYPAHKILASTDPLALDVVASAMIGMNLSNIPILQAAAESGLGESQLENIELLGDYSSPPLLRGYKLPKRFGTTKKRNYQAVVKVIDFLKARPVVNIGKCKNCNACVDSCPMQAIDKDSKRIDYATCIECMCCHEFCMFKAIDLRKDNKLAGALMKVAGLFSSYK